jgi:hypothetical protein
MIYVIFIKYVIIFIIYYIYYKFKICNIYNKYKNIIDREESKDVEEETVMIFVGWNSPPLLRSYDRL